MRCTERKIRLSGEEVVFDCELLTLGEGYGVVKYVMNKGRRVHGLELPDGTITLGLYYAGRPYNLYYWIAPDGSSSATRSDGASPTRSNDPWRRDLGYYFNVADLLELNREVIAYRDLVVDVLVLPDGSARAVDEEELPGDLDGSLRRHIEAARDELLAHHESIIREARGLLEPFAASL